MDAYNEFDDVKNVIRHVKCCSYDDRWQIFAALFDSLGVDLVESTKKRGFDPENLETTKLLMMQASEIFEAFDAYRCNDGQSEKCPEFTHLEEELADAVLRIMIDSSAKGWNTAGACIAKDAYNQTRPLMHGGKKF